MNYFYIDTLVSDTKFTIEKHLYNGFNTKTNTSLYVICQYSISN